MVLRHRLTVVSLGLALCMGVAAAQPARTLPEKLPDAEFWRLVSEMSEQNGHFPSDNLVSNELTYQWVIPALQRRGTGGRAYLGVGPDQNFTYIAALEPSIAFIVDIRRDNLRLQLLYKALIEISPTRAGFLSRLFSRAAPPSVWVDESAGALLDAFREVAPSQALFLETLAVVRAHLIVQHGFGLTPDDMAGIEHVMSAFAHAGPLLTYGNTGSVVAWRGRHPTYQDLMAATDEAGVPRSYLAGENVYGRLRSLQLRNLIVPVVGDFAGPKALRQVGEYLHAHRAVVGTIYTSNVEQYLFQYGTWKAYYDNVATLPLDEQSTFVRSCFNACMTVPGSRSAQLLDPVAALLRDVAAGRVLSYYDVLAHSRQ